MDNPMQHNLCELVRVLHAILLGSCKAAQVHEYMSWFLEGCLLGPVLIHAIRGHLVRKVSGDVMVDACKHVALHLVARVRSLPPTSVQSD